MPTPVTPQISMLLYSVHRLVIYVHQDSIASSGNDVPGLLQIVPGGFYDRLLALGSLISLASEVSGSAASRAEKAREDWLDDRSEDDTGAVGDR